MMNEASAAAVKTLKASAARLRKIARRVDDLEAADDIAREAALIDAQIAALESANVAAVAA